MLKSFGSEIWTGDGPEVVAPLFRLARPDSKAGYDDGAGTIRSKKIPFCLHGPEGACAALARIGEWPAERLLIAHGPLSQQMEKLR